MHRDNIPCSCIPGAKAYVVKRISRTKKRTNIGVSSYIWQLQRALDARHDNPHGTTFELYMHNTLYEKNYKKYSSFDAAVEHIKQVRAKEKSDISVDATVDSRKINTIVKLVQNGFDDEPYPIFTWYVTDDGEILHGYSNLWGSQYTQGTPPFTVPFQPGDIVSVDCSPFENPAKMVILENKDTLDSIDPRGVTCLYINHHYNIHFAYFKSNIFDGNYVSPLYRAKICNGELTEADAPLGIISNAIKENPKVGSDLFRFYNKYVSFVDDATERSSSYKPYYGVGWKRIASEFKF